MRLDHILDQALFVSIRWHAPDIPANQAKSDYNLVFVSIRWHPMHRLGLQITLNQTETLFCFN